MYLYRYAESKTAFLQAGERGFTVTKMGPDEFRQQL